MRPSVRQRVDFFSASSPLSAASEPKFPRRLPPFPQRGSLPSPAAVTQTMQNVSQGIACVVVVQRLLGTATEVISCPNEA